MKRTEAKFLVPECVYSLACPYDNHIPESTIFPQLGTKKLASGHNIKSPLYSTYPDCLIEKGSHL
jgi:hypothetical protein